jgi:hypothetical protein
MCQISHLIFASMAHYKVEVPVLSAIGCGAFRGRGLTNSHEVPRLWAAAMIFALSLNRYKFKLIILSLPTFNNQDNMGPVRAAALADGPRPPASWPSLFGRRTSCACRCSSRASTGS